MKNSIKHFGALMLLTISAFAQAQSHKLASAEEVFDVSRDANCWVAPEWRY
jgi:hypothetical protein